MLHLVRFAAGESVNPEVADGETMKRAITLTEWHKHETARIYEIFARGDEGNQQEELAQWIARRGGKITPRDLYCYGPRRFRGKKEEAEEALNDLVKAGFGYWENASSSQKGVGQKWCLYCGISGIWNHNFTKRPFCEVLIPIPVIPPHKHRTQTEVLQMLHHPKVAGQI